MCNIQSQIQVFKRKEINNMNKIDFSNYKFRCSSLGKLMTTARLKTDSLSQTTKSYLEELWIKEVYGREKYDTTNKYTEKGVMVESDSMDLVKTVTGVTYFKNNKHLENDFIQGTPDIIVPGKIVDGTVIHKPLIKDIKSSWSIWTFQAITEDSAKKDYGYQMLGYMWLSGAIQAELMYCLVNTPEEIMNDELYKLSFKYPEMNDSDEKMEPFKRNYIFDDIPASERLKKFVLNFSEEDVEMLKEKVMLSRQYMQGISL